MACFLRRHAAGSGTVAAGPRRAIEPAQCAASRRPRGALRVLKPGAGAAGHSGRFIQDGDPP